MAREHAERLLASIAALGARRIAALAFVGLIVMAVIGVGAYYLGQPQQQILYSGLTRDDVGRMGAALKEAGIDFDVTADGTTVTVNYGDTARARMLLAEKGLPQSADSGYELFNQIGTFGLTSFMQGVTKTRALEGELARTIQGMSGVKAARVHLVLPDSGSFRSDQQAGSASVVISTEMPTDTTPAQAIRHLVAAAVPGLKLDNVTVLNTEGAVLASGGDIESASAGKMSMVTQTVSREIEDKVRRTLTPYLGLGNFQVSVVSRLNMDRKTISETIYDPSSRVERSVRTIKENALAQNSSSDAAASVQSAIPESATGADGGKNSNETNERREELTNYEVSSKTIETASEGFEIENLSIAVLVNKQRLTATAAEGADPVPIEHQMMDIEQLVASASGYSKERGDQLKVAAVAFIESTPEEIAAPGMFAKLTDQFGALINALALVVVAIIAIMLGLRPALKAILAPSGGSAPSHGLLTAGDGQFGGDAVLGGGLGGGLGSGLNVGLGGGEIGGLGGLVGLGGPGGRFGADPGVNLVEDVTEKMSRSPQKRLEQIVELDETQAAAILRQWLRQDEAA
jgi:flagellar M-ring protein FliF